MCDYCAAVLNDAKVPEELIEYPLTIGAANFEEDLGTFDVWISNDGDLSANFSFGTLDVESVQIHYCPMCGQNLDELRKKKAEKEAAKKAVDEAVKQAKPTLNDIVRVTIITKNGEMKYSSQHGREILAKGFRGAYEFAVISFGTHPCCYIRIPNTHPLFGKSGDAVQVFDNEITYVDEYLKDIDMDGDGWWIGWDHAHCTDYTGFDLLFSILSIFDDDDMDDEDDDEAPKMWSTDEMIKECLDAIDILIAKEDKK